jgi:hypothetical protein
MISHQEKVIRELCREGQRVEEADHKYLSHAHFEHINVFGKYSFPLGEKLARKQLRPLWRPGWRTKNSAF